MTLVVQREIPIIILLTVLICTACVIVGSQIKKADPYAKPTGIVFLALWFVEIIDGQVLSIMRKSCVKNMGPYIGTLAIYLLLANTIGLFGLPSPTMNYSVTLSLALITWIMIQYTAIREHGIGTYIHGFFEPIFVFVVPNIFGKLAPLISMSIRLFGNILSGTIIMTLLYSATMGLTNMIFNFIFGSDFIINIFGVIVAPALHVYFDCFAGFIQMFIFMSLTMVLVSNELKEE